MCLKSNRTVHAARTTFEKALLSRMSQCLYGFENQISVFCDNYIFFARFSVKALCLLPFCENLKKLRIFFFFGAKDERRTPNQPEIFCPS